MRWQWVPPREAAAAIVRGLAPEADATPAGGRTYPLMPFQEAAAHRAAALLARRGGTVVADDVGLGKTYVALALIEDAVVRGRDVALLIPAALRGTWTPLARRVERGGGNRGTVCVVSHARLSRGTHDAARLASAGLVVVDEAHAFRNPATRRYRALAEAARGRPLLLLTATPVNNRVADLYHLIRLFAADDAFHDLGVTSLRGAFLDAPEEAGPREDALRVVREVVVRRSRDDVEGPCSGGARAAGFPRREPTRVIRYDDARTPALVDGIAALELAAYPDSSDGLLRLGLLKRLESGAPALRGSLGRLAELLRRCAGAAERGRLLRPRDVAAGVASDGDRLQLVLEEVVLEAAPPDVDLAALARSARRDVSATRRMLACLEGRDPKLDALRSWLEGRPRGEKAVIFTEFRDTAAAIWRALVPLGGVGRVDGQGAWLGSRPSGRRAVVERFAPRAAGARRPPERERVDLLVATDVLSEGLNLQDARVVVCYDLPWNPVRLFQRIGRVDRLGSPHESVEPVLFVPGAGLERVLGLTRSIRAKLGGIAATVGAAEAGELLALLGTDGAADPLRRIRPSAVDPWERLRSLAREAAGWPSASPPADDGRLLSAEDGAGASEWLVLVSVGDRTELVRIRDGREPGAPGPGSVAALERLLGAPPAAAGTPAAAAPPAAAGLVAPGEPGLEREADEMARLAISRVRRSRSREAVPPPDINARGPEARLSRRIAMQLRDLGPDPDDALLGRVDAALARLARPLEAGGRAALERLAAAMRSEGGQPSADLAALLDSVDRVLAAPDRPPGAPRQAPPGAESTAVLVALRVAVDGPKNGPRRG